MRTQVDELQKQLKISEHNRQVNHEDATKYLRALSDIGQIIDRNVV